jgi:hypothetical protein
VKVVGLHHFDPERITQGRNDLRRGGVQGLSAFEAVPGTIDQEVFGLDFKTTVD